MIDSMFRKNRLRLSELQQNVLAHFFRANPFPSAKQKDILSVFLQIPPHSIQVWFQNQRQKHKLHRHSPGELDYGGADTVPGGSNSAKRFNALVELAAMELLFRDKINRS
ncbi:hypothetical protein PAPHI01_0304 [Pancytospora philotis]|nr:hypothetical protein PAPHI01_0304 [Pancytospora philotis]